MASHLADCYWLSSNQFDVLIPTVAADHSIRRSINLEGSVTVGSMERVWARFAYAEEPFQSLNSHATMLDSGCYKASLHHSFPEVVGVGPAFDQLPALWYQGG